MVSQQQWLRERASMLRYTCTACFINLSEILLFYCVGGGSGEANPTGLWKQNAYKQLARLWETKWAISINLAKKTDHLALDKEWLRRRDTYTAYRIVTMETHLEGRAVDGRSSYEHHVWWGTMIHSGSHVSCKPSSTLCTRSSCTSVATARLTS